MAAPTSTPPSKESLRSTVTPASSSSSHRHSTFIPTSLLTSLLMKPMSIGTGPMTASPLSSSPSSRSSSALYRQYRQRPSIIIAFVVVLLLMLIHSLPRRNVMSKGNHQNLYSDESDQGNSLYDVFDNESPQNNIIGETPHHDLPPIQPLDASQAIEDATTVPISAGTVSLGDDYDALPFLHCGPTYASGGVSAGRRELILLHGAKFTAATWNESGILSSLCLLGNGGGRVGDLSVTALDLPVSADARHLSRAFGSLRDDGVLSGEPVFVVTPSASGSAIVSALTYETYGDGAGMDGEVKLSTVLRSVVRGWIPVAAGSVLKADDVLFGLLPKACIPVLAIYGNQDSMGRESSMKLVHLANAKSLELEGKHPCYLDSPDAFVRAVIDFVDATEKGKQEGTGCNGR